MRGVSQNLPSFDDEIMTNLEKYINAFVQSLNIEEEKVPTLSYQSISNWDSIGHMQLVGTLEDSFDIMLDTDDIIEFSSFDIGKKILEKYDIKF